jgi:hypothetical protein
MVTIHLKKHQEIYFWGVINYLYQLSYQIIE